MREACDWVDRICMYSASVNIRVVLLRRYVIIIVRRLFSCLVVCRVVARCGSVLCLFSVVLVCGVACSCGSRMYVQDRENARAELCIRMGRVGGASDVRDSRTFRMVVWALQRTVYNVSKE